MSGESIYENAKANNSIANKSRIRDQRGMRNSVSGI